MVTITYYFYPSSVIVVCFSFGFTKRKERSLDRVHATESASTLYSVIILQTFLVPEKPPQ
jgi:hypothetical protein